jgi:hypothetical protein
MNEMVAAKVIQDFQVTRSSLEHVFIHFAKFQLGSGVQNQGGFLGQPMVGNQMMNPQM